MHTIFVACNEKEWVINTYINSGIILKIDPWVKHTGWYNYFNTLKVESLLALINKPNPGSELTLTAI